MAKKRNAHKKPGRPAGSRTARRDIVAASPSRCAKCGSTDRTPYTRTIIKQIDGLRDGNAYTHVAWRRTTCAACGQAREDKAFENRTGPVPNEIHGPDAEREAPTE